ncbi:MAG: S-adenosylmethionine:tRNA-ribosyltransferase-isomerase (queuine synthetase) [Frankiales bacterium]|nr:S-adenosylmethionine:tRNA-ribosyltransferase-isomerase (queuine synthetase) [Frankiales bacterium]
MSTHLQTHSATEPAEARGLERDEVRLLVAAPDRLVDSVFLELPDFLEPGDLVVVNRSATLAASVDGTRSGVPVEVHFASALDDGTWVVEVRPQGLSFGPVADVAVGERIGLPAGAWLDVLETLPGQARLHRAAVAVEGPVTALLGRHGRPISYGYVPRRWPLSAYQTVFAVEPGSAEMPSAARPFTPRTVTDLATRGVLVAPVTLHTGVSSPEVGEPPNPERFDVPATTAALVNSVHWRGGRVVAVGTTVTRALETVADAAGFVRPGRGWTDLVLGTDRPARVVTGLVTGWHEPGASHVHLLEAVAGPALVADAYDHAGREGYLWHEFGDSCLLLP